MAGGQERALRRRIRTIESTKKITRAMELIAASQIVRAQNRIAAAAPYEEAVTLVAEEIAVDLGEHAGRFLGAAEDPKNVLILGIVADRGLCGAYNANVLRSVERTIRAGRSSGIEYRIVTSGKKAPPFLRFRGLEVEHSFTGFSDRPKFEDAMTVALRVTAPFVGEEVDQVLVVSTRYLSAGTQVVETRQLLPIPVGSGGDSAEEQDESDRRSGTEMSASAVPTPGAEGYTEFEPHAEDLLDELVGRYVEASIFSAMLQAAASEHTARQRAMAAATENADELTKTLTRVMNRARQDAITTEIMEIVGGAEALRQGPEEG
jgi:F-type H+-transporting ATPase subunit gamma